MEQSADVITFINVGLARGNRPLFSNLNLELSEKRIGIIGNNGSGKSSFLRLVNGLLLPDSGKVVACGLDTQRDRKKLPAAVGFLFQNPDHQIVFPTVAEEIAFVLRERGSDSASARAAALQLLAVHGHANWADRPVHQLSDGQKQLVCILAVTIGTPRVLLLDEPLSSLDLPTRRDLMMRLGMLPHMLIMASHDLELLAEFDRVIWFENGTVRRDGRADGVIGAYRSSFEKPFAPGLAAQ
jgi:biotin transport system ATP-binding protein